MRGAPLRQKSGAREQERKADAEHQMPAELRPFRLRHDAGRRSARCDEMDDIGVDRPVREHDGDQHGRGRHRRGRRLRTPGDGAGGDDQRHQRGERQRIVPARQHQDRGGGQERGERARRYRIDPRRLRRRPIEQARDDQGRGQPEADHDVEGVRRQRVDTAIDDPGERPRDREPDGRDGEPAPHPHPRQHEGRRRHHRQIDVERPIIGTVGGDQERRHIGADQAEPGQRRSVQQRGRERRQRHHAEQQESGGREEAVERIGGIDIRIRDGGADRGENAGNMRARQARR